MTWNSVGKVYWQNIRKGSAESVVVGVSNSLVQIEEEDG